MSEKQILNKFKNEFVLKAILNNIQHNNKLFKK